VAKDLYKDGGYLEKNPTWHEEDAPWKADHIMKMLTAGSLSPKSVCEIGCGSGEILKQLQSRMDSDVKFCGYEVSPQAFGICGKKANDRLQFHLEDLTKKDGAFFDLLLVMDVVEHVEDYIGVLRDIKTKAGYKLFHIPLEISAYEVLRRRYLETRKAYGHIHYFSKETILDMLKDLGYEIVSYTYTSVNADYPAKTFLSSIFKKIMRLVYGMNKDMAVRVLGGYSILILAK